MCVVTVFDLVSKTYSQPSFFPNFEAAKRSFSYQFKNDPMLSMNSSDFVLCEIAEWSPIHGTLLPAGEGGLEVSMEVLLNGREEV